MKTRLLILLFAFSLSSLFAQGFYFGRNKVQYNDFDWHILKTEHFDIYYYPEMEDVAEKGAYFAEESYEILQTKFNHTINRRVPLIFYSSHLHFQQTNITPGFIPEGVGGFFEFLKGRVVIPSNGNLNQFKKVIRHELVHVFMHSKVDRVLKNKGKLDGAYPPLWFTEGLAEVWSSKWDSQAEMILKNAVLHNYMVPLDQMYRINGTYMMYKVGQNVLEYIKSNYGEDKLLLLMENLWKHSRFEDSFKETLGKNYLEFDEEWLYYLKKKYYPKLKTDDFSAKITHTVVRNGYNFKPSYYEIDGKKHVVFMANRTGYSSIYTRPLEPLKIRQDDDAEILIKGEESSDFEAFHLFSSKIDVNNNGLLTFGSKSGEKDALYIYDLKERETLNKYYFENLTGILSPAWSPDGKKIAFAGLDFSGYKDIYIFNTENEEVTKLTNDFYDDNDPTWSPDGNRLVFSSDRTEFGKQWAYNLFVMNINTGDISYITYGKHKDTSPVYSKDGQSILFTSDRDTSLNIYLAKLDRKNQTINVEKISNFTGSAFDPEWTPEGGIIFAVFEKGTFQIRYVEDIETLREKNKSTKIFNLPTIAKSKAPWSFSNYSHDKEPEKFKYAKDFDLDIAQTQVSQDPIFGTSGGAQLAFTDILGNDQYHILIYNNAQTSDEFLKSFNFALTKVNLKKRTNFAYGLFRYAGRFFNYQDGFFNEDRTGGFFALSYPLSQFMRLEYNTSLSYSDKRKFYIFNRIAWLTSNHVSFVKDNTIWSSTGPIDGQRFKVSIGNTFDIRFSNVNYFTAMLDFRNYMRLGLRSTYAFRVLSLINEGKEARQYYLGSSWDMRGYPRWSIRGQRIFFTSQELRFPFIDLLGIRFPFGTIGFNSIRAALFLDAGNAWDDEFKNFNEWQNSLIGSFGLGFRMRLIGFLVLRLDFGKRTDFNTVSDGIFSQFFFGWDF
jgi:WD40 repeat protein